MNHYVDVVAMRMAEMAPDSSAGEHGGREGLEPARVLFVTGAGMSAESGLPTYRGVSGLYNQGVTEDGVDIEEAISGAMLQRRPAVAWKCMPFLRKVCLLFLVCRCCAELICLGYRYCTN